MRGDDAQSGDYKEKCPKNVGFSGTVNRGSREGLFHLGLFEHGLVCLCGLKDTISGTGSNVVFLEIFSDELD